MPDIEKEVDEYDGDPWDLIGYQHITGHMIFDVKMGENFRRKSRFVAGGHKIEAANSITYCTVVSCDFVSIYLTIAALNDLYVLKSNV